VLRVYIVHHPLEVTDEGFPTISLRFYDTAVHEARRRYDITFYDEIAAKKFYRIYCSFLDSSIPQSTYDELCEHEIPSTLRVQDSDDDGFDIDEDDDDEYDIIGRYDVDDADDDDVDDENSYIVHEDVVKGMTSLQLNDPGNFGESQRIYQPLHPFGTKLNPKKQVTLTDGLDSYPKKQVTLTDDLYS